MKKKLLILVVCLALIMIGVYSLYNHVVPKAGIIDYPEYNLIESITVYDAGGTKIDINEDDYEALYSYICQSIPTRKISVNEVPYIKPFYTVAIESEKLPVNGWYAHIYKENETAYLEIPYVGVYEINKDVLNLLAN